jgi:hypothetical protein
VEAAMTLEERENYWKLSFESYYESYFQELASEALLARWDRIDVVTAFLIAFTASGSAIAGWTMWNEPGWRALWVLIAAIASVFSVVHGVMRVAARIREQEELRGSFSQLRTEFETFRHFLRLSNTDSSERVRSRYEKLRENLGGLRRRSRPDIAYTTRLRQRVQNNLNSILTDRGVIV